MGTVYSVVILDYDSKRMVCTFYDYDFALSLCDAALRAESVSSVAIYRGYGINGGWSAEDRLHREVAP